MLFNSKGFINQPLPKGQYREVRLYVNYTVLLQDKQQIWLHGVFKMAL